MTETRCRRAVMAARVAGDGDVGGEGKAGKELRVFAGVDDLLGELGAVRPEGDLVAAAAVERERDGGSPGAGTRTAMRLMRAFLRSEAGFRAGEQAADVLVMLDDDEQGDGELRRR